MRGFIPGLRQRKRWNTLTGVETGLLDTIDQPIIVPLSDQGPVGLNFMTRLALLRGLCRFAKQD